MTAPVIVEPMRTPRGRAGPRGSLGEVRPIELVAHLMTALAGRLDVGAIEDVVLGCSTQSGEQGTNLARIAALFAGWPDSVGGATVNRFCASGIDAIAGAAARVAAGAERAVAAGGVESMSRAPMFSDRGPWFADPEVARRTGYVHMALAADLLAERAGISRAELDAYAASSQARAAAAAARGRPASVVPLGGLEDDEAIRAGITAERLGRLPPLLSAEEVRAGLEAASARDPSLAGLALEPRHTIGTSPAIADGAGLLVVCAADAGLGRARARIRGWATAGVEPVTMLTGNLPATRRALERAGLGVADVDLFEVNESFAAVPIHYCRELGVDPDRVNVAGGAIARGHPLGATGPILVATLIEELERRDLAIGVASICGGAGVASALVIERQ